MKYFRIIILSLPLIGGPLLFSIYGQLKLEAEFRPRVETRRGYQELSIPGAVTHLSVSQRTRLSFQYATEKIRLIITPQDVRIWGDEQISSNTGVYGDDASLELFEAYTEMRLGPKSLLSVGRQQLVYDNERLLAARNWNQNGLSYDAIVYKRTSDFLEFHAGASWNSASAKLAGNLYSPDRIKTLEYLWFKHSYGERGSISLIHVASGFTVTDTTNRLFFRQTTGLSTALNYGNFKGQADFHYQFGRNGSGETVSAFLSGAECSAELSWITPGLGANYLSGDRDLDDNRDHLFNNLYGARHRYFGYMDYFSDFKSDTRSGGLTDLYFFIENRLPRKLTLTNTSHYFLLARLNTLTGDSNRLGIENDLVLSLKTKHFGSLKGGIMFLLPFDGLRMVQGIPDGRFSQFFFLEWTYAPKIL